MKIGIDCHNLEGKRTGTGRYLMNLLRYWTNKNAEFILYFKNQIPDDVPESKIFQKKVLNTNSNTWFEHILLPRAIKDDNIEVFFSPSYILPFRVPKGVKTAVAIHDISYEAHPEWYSFLNRILLRRVSKKSAQKANLIFTCSEFTKNEILKHYHCQGGVSKIDEDKIKVIYLAADEKFIPNPLIKKRKLIFYVGAIFNRRFIPQIVEAYKKIKNKLPDYKLLIVGPNYTKPFTEIKSDDFVKYIDYVKDEELISLYNSTELFIWLSSYEGFGLPPLEAMACGTPVLSTKKTSLAEVLGDYPIWVENPENIDEISEKILKILNDENLRNEMIKKGLERVDQFFWRKTAQETFNALINYER